MNWVAVKDRLPREEETLDGRVPIVDKDGYLGYAILCHTGYQDPWLMSEFDVEYWIPVPQLKKD